MKFEFKLPGLPKRELTLREYAGGSWHSVASTDGYLVAVYVTPLRPKR